MAVPEVLVNGNHEQIRNWRRKTALAKTLRNRPDLLERVRLTDEDEELLAEIRLGLSQGFGTEGIDREG
jgi:tRNA (guanine37-N1)-methyltransferase